MIGFLKDSLSTPLHYAKEWTAQLANVQLNRTVHLMRPDKKHDSCMFKQSLQGHPRHQPICIDSSICSVSAEAYMTISVRCSLSQNRLFYWTDSHVFQPLYKGSSLHVNVKHLKYLLKNFPVSFTCFNFSFTVCFVLQGLLNVCKLKIKDWNFKNKNLHSILLPKIINVQAES